MLIIFLGEAEYLPQSITELSKPFLGVPGFLCFFFGRYMALMFILGIFNDMVKMNYIAL